MGRAALLIALSCGSGCVVSFGELPCDCRDGDLCFASGALDPRDPCRECVPEASDTGLTDVCAQAIHETSFADFSDGTMPRSLGNLYVSADGAVRVVRTSDLNDDGRPDLVFSNFTNGTLRALDSFVYFGAEDGFSAEARAALPTFGSIDNAIADLDADGFVDLVFTNHLDDASSYDVPSVVYWGAQSGFDASRRSSLPTRAGHGCAVADLNADGYLDIVFANILSPAGGYAVDSYVYWGSAGGFFDANRSAIPTVGAASVSIADLNADGHLDLVFSSYYDGASYLTRSPIFWGSASGFSAAQVTALPTTAPGDNTIADVNGDGYLDIVFSSYFDGATYAPPSLVYLGSAAGFADASRIEIPTTGVFGVSVDDLDRDGQLDYAFAALFDGTTRRIDSPVFLGSGGTALVPPIGFPTTGALGVQTADLDLDGFSEVVIGSHVDDALSYARDSLVFGGSSSGPTPSASTPLPTVGAQTGTRADLGNVYDRSDAEEYVSSPILLPRGATPTRLSWLAETPHGSSIAFSLRSAETPEELDDAEWQGPSDEVSFYTRPLTRISSAHAGRRYIQYRATFRTPGFVSRPVLHAVSVHYRGGE
jgi:hypothetical protein